MKQALCEICKELIHIPEDIKFVNTSKLKKGMKLKPYYWSTYSEKLNKKVSGYWAPCDTVFTIQEIYGEVVFFTVENGGNNVLTQLKGGFKNCKLID